MARAAPAGLPCRRAEVVVGVIRIGEGHNGERFRASVGDTVELVLPEVATSGFQWHVDELVEPLQLERSDLVGPDGPQPGASGERHIVVRAVAPGSGHLHVQLRRSWDPPEKIGDSYAVDIEVS